MRRRRGADWTHALRHYADGLHGEYVEWIAELVERFNRSIHGHLDA